MNVLKESLMKVLNAKLEVKKDNELETEMKLREKFRKDINNFKKEVVDLEETIADLRIENKSLKFSVELKNEDIEKLKEENRKLKIELDTTGKDCNTHRRLNNELEKENIRVRTENEIIDKLIKSIALERHDLEIWKKVAMYILDDESVKQICAKVEKYPEEMYGDLLGIDNEDTPEGAKERTKDEAKIADLAKQLAKVTSNEETAPGKHSTAMAVKCEQVSKILARYALKSKDKKEEAPAKSSDKA